jgi:hypothetical protein
MLTFLVTVFIEDSLLLSVTAFHCFGIPLVLLDNSGLPLLQFDQVLLNSIHGLAQVCFELRIFSIGMRWDLADDKFGMAVQIEVCHLQVALLLADGRLGQQHPS